MFRTGKIRRFETQTGATNVKGYAVNSVIRLAKVLFTLIVVAAVILIPVSGESRTEKVSATSSVLCYVKKLFGLGPCAYQSIPEAKQVSSIPPDVYEDFELDLPKRLVRRSPAEGSDGKDVPESSTDKGQLEKPGGFEAAQVKSVTESGVEADSMFSESPTAFRNGSMSKSEGAEEDQKFKIEIFEYLYDSDVDSLTMEPLLNDVTTVSPMTSTTSATELISLSTTSPAIDIEKGRNTSVKDMGQSETESEGLDGDKSYEKVRNKTVILREEDKQQSGVDIEEDEEFEVVIVKVVKRKFRNGTIVIREFEVGSSEEEVTSNLEIISKGKSKKVKDTRSGAAAKEYIFQAKKLKSKSNRKTLITLPGDEENVEEKEGLRGYLKLKQLKTYVQKNRVKSHLEEDYYATSGESGSEEEVIWKVRRRSKKKGKEKGGRKKESEEDNHEVVRWRVKQVKDKSEVEKTEIEKSSGKLEEEGEKLEDGGGKSEKGGEKLEKDGKLEDGDEKLEESGEKLKKGGKLEDGREKLKKGGKLDEGGISEEEGKKLKKGGRHKEQVDEETEFVKVVRRKLRNGTIIVKEYELSEEISDESKSKSRKRNGTERFLESVFHGKRLKSKSDRKTYLGLPGDDNEEAEKDTKLWLHLRRLGTFVRKDKKKYLTEDYYEAEGESESEEDVSWRRRLKSKKKSGGDGEEQEVMRWRLRKKVKEQGLSTTVSSLDDTTAHTKNEVAITPISVETSSSVKSEAELTTQSSVGVIDKPPGSTGGSIMLITTDRSAEERKTTLSSTSASSTEKLETVSFAVTPVELISTVTPTSPTDELTSPGPRETVHTTTSEALIFEILERIPSTTPTVENSIRDNEDTSSFKETVEVIKSKTRTTDSTPPMTAVLVSTTPGEGIQFTTPSAGTLESTSPKEGLQLTTTKDDVLPTTSKDIVPPSIHSTTGSTPSTGHIETTSKDDGGLLSTTTNPVLQSTTDSTIVVTSNLGFNSSVPQENLIFTEDIVTTTPDTDVRSLVTPPAAILETTTSLEASLIATTSKEAIMATTVKEEFSITSTSTTPSEGLVTTLATLDTGLASTTPKEILTTEAVHISTPKEVVDKLATSEVFPATTISPADHSSHRTPPVDSGKLPGSTTTPTLHEILETTTFKEVISSTPASLEVSSSMKPLITTTESQVVTHETKTETTTQPPDEAVDKPSEIVPITLVTTESPAPLQTTTLHEKLETTTFKEVMSESSSPSIQLAPLITTTESQPVTQITEAETTTQSRDGVIDKPTGSTEVVPLGPATDRPPLRTTPVEVVERETPSTYPPTQNLITSTPKETIPGNALEAPSSTIPTLGTGSVSTTPREDLTTLTTTKEHAISTTSPQPMQITTSTDVIFVTPKTDDIHTTTPRDVFIVTTPDEGLHVPILKDFASTTPTPSVSTTTLQEMLEPTTSANSLLPTTPEQVLVSVSPKTVTKEFSFSTTTPKEEVSTSTLETAVVSPSPKEDFISASTTSKDVILFTTPKEALQGTTLQENVPSTTSRDAAVFIPPINDIHSTTTPIEVFVVTTPQEGLHVPIPEDFGSTTPKQTVAPTTLQEMLLPKTTPEEVLLSTTTPKEVLPSTLEVVSTTPKEVIVSTSPTKTTKSTTQKHTESTTAKPTKFTTPKSTESTTSKPTKSTTAKPTKSTTSKPTESTTSKPTKSTTPKSTESTTSKIAKSTTQKPTESTTSKPTKSTTPKPTESTTSKPTKSTTPKSTESTTSKPTTIPTSKSTTTRSTKVTPTPTKKPIPTEPISTSEGPSNETAPCSLEQAKKLLSADKNHDKNSDSMKRIKELLKLASGKRQPGPLTENNHPTLRMSVNELQELVNLTNQESPDNLAGIFKDLRKREEDNKLHLIKTVRKKSRNGLIITRDYELSSEEIPGHAYHRDKNKTKSNDTPPPKYNENIINATRLKSKWSRKTYLDLPSKNGNFEEVGNDTEWFRLKRLDTYVSKDKVKEHLLGDYEEASGESGSGENVRWRIVKGRVKAGDKEKVVRWERKEVVGNVSKNGKEGESSEGYHRRVLKVVKRRFRNGTVAESKYELPSEEEDVSWRKVTISNGSDSQEQVENRGWKAYSESVINGTEIKSNKTRKSGSGTRTSGIRWKYLGTTVGKLNKSSPGGNETTTSTSELGSDEESVSYRFVKQTRAKNGSTDDEEDDDLLKWIRKHSRRNKTKRRHRVVEVRRRKLSNGTFLIRRTELPSSEEIGSATSHSGWKNKSNTTEMYETITHSKRVKNFNGSTSEIYLTLDGDNAKPRSSNDSGSAKDWIRWKKILTYKKKAEKDSPEGSQSEEQVAWHFSKSTSNATKFTVTNGTSEEDNVIRWDRHSYPKFIKEQSRSLGFWEKRYREINNSESVTLGPEDMTSLDYDGEGSPGGWREVSTESPSDVTLGPVEDYEKVLKVMSMKDTTYSSVDWDQKMEQYSGVTTEGSITSTPSLEEEMRAVGGNTFETTTVAGISEAGGQLGRSLGGKSNVTKSTGQAEKSSKDDDKDGKPRPDDYKAYAGNDTHGPDALYGLSYAMARLAEGFATPKPESTKKPNVTNVQGRGFSGSLKNATTVGEVGNETTADGISGRGFSSADGKDNKRPTVTSNAKANKGTSVATAMSNSGSGTQATAINGSSADATAYTKNSKGADAIAKADTHGAGGAKSTAMVAGNGSSMSVAKNRGGGNATSHAQSSDGSAKSSSMASNSTSSSGAFAMNQGNASSSSVASGVGSSKSQAATKGKGSAKSQAFANGTGDADSHSVSNRGESRSNATALSGDATSKSRAGGEGSSVSNALTKDGGNAHSTSEGDKGDAMAMAVVDGEDEDGDFDNLDFDSIMEEEMKDSSEKVSKKSKTKREQPAEFRREKRSARYADKPETLNELDSGQNSDVITLKLPNPSIKSQDQVHKWTWTSSVFDFIRLFI